MVCTLLQRHIGKANTIFNVTNCTCVVLYEMAFSFIWHIIMSIIFIIIVIGVIIAIADIACYCYYIGANGKKI